MRRLWHAGSILLLAVWPGLEAGPLEERFEEANRAYEAEDYGQAEAGYRAILEYGAHAPEVYFNLGNAAFRQARLGQAILNYERALRLDPADTDARHNLEFCLRQIADRREPPRHWLSASYGAWTRFVGADGEAWLLLGLYLPGMAVLGVWMAAQKAAWRRMARFVAIGLLLLAAPAAGLVVLRAGLGAADSGAIVMVDKVEGRSGPDEDHATLFAIHEGLRVEIRNESGTWVQVLLPNGLNGWVPESSVERI